MPTITFKVTPTEALRIRGLARRDKCTVSEYLRRRAMGPATTNGGGDADYRITASSVTGLPVMHGPATLPRVTSDEVRALLADFP